MKQRLLCPKLRKYYLGVPTSCMSTWVCWSTLRWHLHHSVRLDGGLKKVKDCSLTPLLWSVWRLDSGSKLALRMDHVNGCLGHHLLDGSLLQEKNKFKITPKKPPTNFSNDGQSWLDPMHMLCTEDKNLGNNSHTTEATVFLIIWRTSIIGKPVCWKQNPPHY